MVADNNDDIVSGELAALQQEVAKLRLQLEGLRALALPNTGYPDSEAEHVRQLLDSCQTPEDWERLETYFERFKERALEEAKSIEHLKTAEKEMVKEFLEIDGVGKRLQKRTEALLRVINPAFYRSTQSTNRYQVIKTYLDKVKETPHYPLLSDRYIRALAPIEVMHAELKSVENDLRDFRGYFENQTWIPSIDKNLDRATDDFILATKTQPHKMVSDALQIKENKRVFTEMYKSYLFFAQMREHRYNHRQSTLHVFATCDEYLKRDGVLFAKLQAQYATVRAELFALVQTLKRILAEQNLREPFRREYIALFKQLRDIILALQRIFEHLVPALTRFVSIRSSDTAFAVLSVLHPSNPSVSVLHTQYAALYEVSQLFHAKNRTWYAYAVRNQYPATNVETFHYFMDAFMRNLSNLLDTLHILYQTFDGKRNFHDLLSLTNPLEDFSSYELYKLITGSAVNPMKNINAMVSTNRSGNTKYQAFLRAL